MKDRDHGQAAGEPAPSGGTPRRPYAAPALARRGKLARIAANDTVVSGALR